MSVDLVLFLVSAFQHVAQPQGLMVGSLAIPWSVVITIAGGGAAWATLRADVRAAKGVASRAEKAANDADQGVDDLRVIVGKIEKDTENIWRELERQNRGRDR